MRSLLAVLLALASLPVLADDPCAADAARLCNKADGPVGLLDCMRGHDKELAPACRAQVSALARIAEQYGKDCVGDAKRFCAAVEPGNGRILRCLRDQESFLSQSCQGALNDIRLERANLQAKCAGDVGRFCSTVRDGGWRIVGCLREHEKELESVCRDALGKLP